jgi:Deacetylase PdaC
MMRVVRVATALLFACAAPSIVLAQSTGRIVEATSDVYEFSFGYPAEAAAIPKLRALFEKELKTGQAALIKESTLAKADAAKGDYPYNSYQNGTAWEVAGNTAQLLSLSGFFSSYSGGAHGNYGFGSRIWDRKANKLLKASTNVFAKPATALAMLRDSYCNGLTSARRKKLGADWQPEDDGVFSQCPPFSDLAIVFKAETGKPMTEIAFIAAPYVAGSYAEGEYEVVLPITVKVLAAIKPNYRGSFAVK